MRNIACIIVYFAVLFAIGCVTFGCDSSNNQVVIYVSLDRHLAEPVLKRFEAESAIDVLAVYDTEANKTSGLVNRLIAESSRPRADVYWNNEIAQMYRLAQRGVLAPRPESDRPPLSAGFSETAYWSAFAARARVLVTRESLAIDKRPDSISAFTDPVWKGRAAIANPRFGTTGTHFAALLTVWGEKDFRQWLRDVRMNDVAILPGNAQVMDAVAQGRYDFGLTDTDDVNVALLEGKPVQLIVPDQGEGDIGVFIIPNTVALIEDAPSGSKGQELVRFLLSSEVERLLAQGSGAQIPIRHDVPGPDVLPPRSSLNVMQVDYDSVGQAYERMLQIVDEEWPR